MPAWLSTTSNPETEILLCGLLDNQNDTTFVLQQKADILDTQEEPVQLKLSTLASSTVVPHQKFTGWQDRGFYSSKKIPLPVTYTREFIPVNLSHIPTPNLATLRKTFAPSIKCDISLLIGCNCSQSLLPREVVASNDNEPFVQSTDVGWSIFGCANLCRLC